MPNLEAPTAPPSPGIPAAQIKDSPPPPRRQPPPVPKKAIKADKSTCGICYQRVELKPKAKANIHFNKCWEGLREKAKEPKSQNAKNTLEENEVRDSDETSLETLQVENSELDEREEPSTPIPSFSPDLEKTSCLLCHRDLWGMKDLDAFDHRLICLKILSPARCPVCEVSFRELPEPCDDVLSCESSGWPIHTMIWHLHACQNDCHTCPEAQVDWTALISRRAGRTEVAQRVFWKSIGERKDWGLRKHRDSVKTKKKSGLAREDGIYRTKSSPLRTSQIIVPARESHSESEIEVTRAEKAVVAEKILFDRFIRSSFSIMKLPHSAKMRTDYKPEEVRTEVLPLFDSKTFWKQLSYKAQTQLLPKLVPKPLNVTSPTKKKLPADRALAEKFPVPINKDEAKSQLRLLSNPLEPLAPMTSAANSDALLKAPQRSAIPKNKDELNVFQKKLLDLLKPVADQESVTLPRKVRQFPEITLTCPHEEPDSPPASASLLPMERNQADSVVRSDAPSSNNAMTSAATASQNPSSRTSSPPNDSPSTATTPQHSSLDTKRPTPRTIGSSENWRNSPPNAQERFNKLLRMNTARPYYGRSANPLSKPEPLPNGTRSSPHPWPASFGERRSMAAVTLPVHGKPANPLPESSLEWMFYNFRELDREAEVETYVYGRRGAIPVDLKSNIRTVIDPALSEEEQMAQNRECCRGMFGSFAETSE
ncbi:uncharacterized protein J4E84_004291 [Alternaria hordeiaustralica]|uniref:uncharacterized protein n=1 Tax=Alternaria hordeiaustralica TaxID=1187925 RepID=UPI0020C2AAE3|nr:uncharacterized protein J4E84_004291 [Alternaria hordeiaustralica]KAI4690110.1 hypothetical protein J4E84_004291 [Alternaria hordeiaustralica]